MDIKKIIITESQLNEIENANFSYLDGDDNNHRGNIEITTSDDVEDLDYIKPITTDEYAKLLTPQNYFAYTNMIAYGRGYNNISENNKDIEGKIFRIPNNLLTKLKLILSKIGDKNIDGKKRLTFLIKNPNLNIKELYRLSNFFETEIEGMTNIIGGDDMKTWVNNSITKAKESSKKSKEIKKLMGYNNTHIKPHTKNSGNGKKH